MRNKLPNTCTALVSARQQVHRSSNTWFMCIGVNILCCLSFAALDYSTLFSLFDNNMVAAAWAISVFTFGICVAENFLPMISARFLHQIITLKRKDCSRILLLIISLLLAITLLAFLGNARWQTRNSEIDNDNATLTIETSAAPDGTPTEAASPDDSQEERAQNGIAMLLAVIPWCTSAISFFLAYLTDDPLRRRHDQLEIARLKLQEHLSLLIATHAELKGQNIDEMRQMIINEYQAKRYEVEQLCKEWFADWEQMLMAKIGTEEAIELLSQHYHDLPSPSMPEAHSNNGNNTLHTVHHNTHGAA